MAAIDFPAGPTVGQKFSAANGVEYTWNGTLWVASAGAGGVTVSDTPPSNPQVNQLWFNSLLGTLFVYYNDGNTTQWVPASPNMFVPTTPGGDFMATRTSMSFVTTTAAVCLFDTIVSGNSGGYYNAGNGRFTPPAGRYHFFASAGWASTSAIIGIEVIIRKNGIQAAYAYSAPGINEHGEAVASGQLDANGTDYFDVTLRSSGATPSVSFMPASFVVFPISGVKGPTGDPSAGALTLYSEAVGTGSTAFFNVMFPSNAKAVELRWYLETAADSSFTIRGSVGGVPDSSAKYHFHTLVQALTVVSGGTAYSQVGWNLANDIQFWGSIRFHRPTLGFGEAHYMRRSAAATRSNTVTGLETDMSMTPFNGYYFTSATGNFTVNSYVRCYVVV